MPLPAAQPSKKRYEPLWDRVDANRLRLAGYILVFIVLSVVMIDILLALVVVFFWLLLGMRDAANVGALSHFLMSGGGQSPLPLFLNASVLIAISALAWAFFAIMRSERWLLVRLGAVLVPKGAEVDSKMMLKDMAIAAGLAVAPALYLVDTPNVNAFIVAAPRRRAALGVTRGMLDRLELEEQRAVFANLIAQLRAGDTMTATAVTALMMPVHAWRDWSLKRQEKLNRPKKATAFDPQTGEVFEYVVPDYRAVLFFPALLFGFALAILGELIAAGHRSAQLRAAETADAEGMLLLKEPTAMLDALEKCVRFNNYVPVSDETFGQLFYCWPGSSTDDESDPEWQRVARLREVLGVEGEAWAAERVSSIEFSDDYLPVPPAAPWLESEPVKDASQEA